MPMAPETRPHFIFTIPNDTMKTKHILLLLVALTVSAAESAAQCAMCTKTAQQLGEKPAEGMNSGILYLMLMPFAIVGFIAYRWWKNQRSEEA